MGWPRAVVLNPGYGLVPSLERQCEIGKFTEIVERIRDSVQ